MNLCSILTVELRDGLH